MDENDVRSGMQGGGGFPWGAVVVSSMLALWAMAGYPHVDCTRRPRSGAARLTIPQPWRCGTRWNRYLPQRIPLQGIVSPFTTAPPHQPAKAEGGAMEPAANGHDTVDHGERPVHGLARVAARACGHRGAASRDLRRATSTCIRSPGSCSAAAPRLAQRTSADACGEDSAR